MFGRVVAATVLAAGALVATASGASASPVSTVNTQGFGACMDYAVGQHDIEPWLAHDACDADSFEECYWIFRKQYVPAVIAGTACRIADN
ncbi:hypothetical protein ACFWY9_14385 [Amycolatopsis sp. NPDC059027]|uniref:hypothetical protein n=1 Tax=unclassified Amycolatopsis TaxID=2618356 RepID=UPI00366E1642